MKIENNVQAFLDLIAFSEIGEKLLKASDDGYNVLVGGKLFSSYKDHPRVLVKLGKLGISSTAAGRYQILARYYDAYKKTLKLSDFSPYSQDMIAIQMLKEQKAIPDILAGRIPEAIEKCSNIWASLPGKGNTYGQHIQPLSALVAAYSKAGGALA